MPSAGRAGPGRPFRRCCAGSCGSLSAPCSMSSPEASVPRARPINLHRAHRGDRVSLREPQCLGEQAEVDHTDIAHSIGRLAQCTAAGRAW